jgi:nucleoside-diphosphate-sugar epimerase
MTGRPRSFVTGAAGFIGSHLCERLLDEGHEVLGLDAFIDFYPRPLKETNLAALLGRPGFRFVEGDLLAVDLTGMLDGVEFVFHQAAQPGVLGSWGKRFEEYLSNNVLATQRLLEAARDHLGKLQRLVYASSSSVYGATHTLPLPEDALPRPFSPYGVTKLAGEQLCLLYHQNYGVPAVALRYFTVYGPRQRPDMAFQRFIRSMLSDEEITIYGDGEQTRDFTYISDVVEANLLALKESAEGRVLNIGGGARTTLNNIVALLERLVGRSCRRRHLPAQRGDVPHTFADVGLAARIIGYRPGVPLEDGLRRHIQWAEARVQFGSQSGDMSGGSR